ncbi:Fic family protein [Candidatus Micrarchaeota archaeon]|nr:Fic family protein [Candidatus Micrarchaeota archaeon]
MRKYDILKIVFEAREGATPRAISEQLKIALPNVYNYLNELEEEGLIRKDAGGYIGDMANEKLSLILTLRSMVPAKFHIFISPLFKEIIKKLCKNIRTGKREFSLSEMQKLEKIAAPCRIVLRLSKKPTIYCLKINESLVQALLEYHGLTPLFNMAQFQQEMEKAAPMAFMGATKPAESAPEIIKLCDNYYKAGEDISLFARTRSFAPDERIQGLLKKADLVEKEYLLYLNSVEGVVRHAIEENWEKKYIYNTNSIEGNTMSEKEIDEYFKNGKALRQSISKREFHETTNMRHSLQFLRLKQKEEISEELMQELHFLVQKDIADGAGNYKNHYNYIRPSSLNDPNPTTPPQHIRERVRFLVEWYRQNKDTMHPVVLASIFHMQFEMIHPFADGNGRVGRLLMNHILKQKGKLPVTILEKTKQNYYRALENRSIEQFLLYTLTSFIEEYSR